MTERVVGHGFSRGKPRWPPGVPADRPTAFVATVHAESRESMMVTHARLVHCVCRLAIACLTVGFPNLGHAAPTVGMNGHMPSPRNSELMSQLGASYVRVDFDWWRIEPRQGEFDFANLDRAVAGARANNLRVYGTVGYTPQWAAGVSCSTGSSSSSSRCQNRIPARREFWTNAVTTIVSRYRGQVECWSIWNEPNLRYFFLGTEDDYIRAIFRPAVAAIRAADPTAKLCGPDLATTNSSNWNGWQNDVSNLFRRIGTEFDVITHHIYADDAPGVIRVILDDTIWPLMRRHGLSAKEFWLTETGWEHEPDGDFSPAEVASRIVDLYRKQERVCAGTYGQSTNDPWPNWTRTYYYHFPYDRNSGWGLLDDNQAPLPAYLALQSWTQGKTTSACVMPGAPDAGVSDAAALDSAVQDAAVPDATDRDASGIEVGLAGDAVVAVDASVIVDAQDRDVGFEDHTPSDSGMGMDDATLVGDDASAANDAGQNDAPSAENQGAYDASALAGPGLAGAATSPACGCHATRRDADESSFGSLCFLAAIGAIAWKKRATGVNHRATTR